MIRFTSLNKNSNDYQDMLDLYVRAFPEEERMPIDFLLDQVDKNYIKFDVIRNDETAIGLTIFKSNSESSYLIFFAIKEEYRNKGFGSQVLQILLEEYKDKKLFLAAETLDKNADNYEMRVRRHNFYKRNGLIFYPDLHISEIGVVYSVFANKRFEPKDYIELFETTLTREEMKTIGITCWKD